LTCEACGFDFFKRYGERGGGYIECHHRIPLSESGPTQTRLKDLALVCSNCHRMIHRRTNDWLSLEELKALLAQTPVGSP
jgi:5-methylcytosine-specific restriction protein A